MVQRLRPCEVLSLNTADLIDKFGKIRALVVGDLMLDRFLWGSVSRISPEAPVPVVLIKKEELYPGGASNVGRNLAPFCKKVSVMGRLGNDSDGSKLQTAMETFGIDLAPSIVKSSSRTVCKTRIVARQQQVVRFDQEEVVGLTADEENLLIKRYRETADEYDLVIVQDYGKGLLSQSLIENIAAIAAESSTTLIGDPNARNPLIWSGFSSMKPNLAEAIALSGIQSQQRDGDAVTDEIISRAANILLRKWGIPRLLITLGERGMVHFNSDGKVFHVATRAQQIFDVSGAGDTAISFYSMAIAAGLDERSAVQISNHASGIVVAKFGTAHVEPKEFHHIHFDL